eukprot:10845309-Ditylum_brightwellii.AAC.1
MSASNVTPSARRTTSTRTTCSLSSSHRPRSIGIPESGGNNRVASTLTGSALSSPPNVPQTSLAASGADIVFFPTAAKSFNETTNKEECMDMNGGDDGDSDEE